MKLVLFDLDNTLLAGDSDYEWGQFLIDTGVLDRTEYEARNQSFYDQYKAGTLDIMEFLAFALAPLASHPRETLDAWHAGFMQRRILPMIGAPARALVARHAGDLCAVVTATNSFVTEPIVREFGIPHLLATEPEQDGQGRFTGRVAGIPCFREGKVSRVQAWLAGLGHEVADFDEQWFYSDSANDLPLLERVSHPVAVDPDDRLRAVALQRGWPVLALNR
ncbi:MAG: HAD-IB family hydrolase [Burkholderiales bacterium]|nr:HAD-IB family hydrolase [Burkholderiales bacterium]